MKATRIGRFGVGENQDRYSGGLRRRRRAIFLLDEGLFLTQEQGIVGAIVHSDGCLLPWFLSFSSFARAIIVFPTFDSGHRLSNLDRSIGWSSQISLYFQVVTRSGRGERLALREVGEACPTPKRGNLDADFFS